MRRLDRYSAALSNGSATSWCELDGGFRPAVCHAALYVIPAVLAEGEAIEASFDELRLALLVGYETVARVARTSGFSPFKIHPHGGLASIGASAFEPVMPPPNDRPARVTITLLDGRKLSGECISAQGGRDRSFSDEQILEKIRANVNAIYPESPKHLLPLVQRPHGVCTAWHDLVAEIGKAGNNAGSRN